MEDEINYIFSIIISVLSIGIPFLVLLIIFNKFRKRNPIGLIYLIFGFLVTGYFGRGDFELIFRTVKRLMIDTVSGYRTSNTQQILSNIIDHAFEAQYWYASFKFTFLFILISYWSYKCVKWIKIGKSNGFGWFNHKSILFKNTFSTLVLIVAFYFSICSIIAVPIVKFEEEAETNFSEELKNELAIYTENDSIDEEKLLYEIDKIQYYLDNDTVITQDLKGWLKNNLTDHVNVVKSSYSELELFNKRVLSRMNITDNSNIPKKLKLKDKSILTSWYLESRYKKLDQIKKAQSFKVLLYNYVISGQITESYQLRQFLHTIDNMNQEGYNDIPDRPTLGSDLGTFTSLIGWLLKLESYPLVIIIGLLGFSLLGAGGSTFIKEKKTGETDILIQDLTGVLIKGVTAAIVVFLGVQAGLAILSTNKGELNAYALFFISFTAAVFSDTAWEWAKSKFEENFSGQDDLNKQ